MTTGLELAGRFAKAVALADIADAAGITSDDAALLDAREWRMLAQAARVNDPSRKTQALTISMLNSRLRARLALNPAIKGENA
jgi:hypothetical protein